jgi:hypothetical protein
VKAEADYDCFTAAGTVKRVRVQSFDGIVLVGGWLLLIFLDSLSIGNVAESERYWYLDEQAYAGEKVGYQGGEA